MKQALRFNRHARHRHVAEAPDGEEGAGELVPAAVKRRLPGIPELEGAVNVQVDVTMGPRLATYESIDAPTPIRQLAV